jgi:hypothetical protein
MDEKILAAPTLLSAMQHERKAFASKLLQHRGKSRRFADDIDRLASRIARTGIEGIVG